MSIAKEVIVPNTKGIFRTVFLYVGQGEATLMAIPDGENYSYLLIDCNIDKNNEGIDLIKMLKDLLEKEKLSVFVNTHPHNDHLLGINDIYDQIGILEVWHSGHKPGKKHEDAYKNLEYVIKKVGSQNVFILKGSNSINKLDEVNHPIGQINYQVLSPAEYVIDDIDGEKPDERAKRIHEQCGVIKFSFGNPQQGILITGDSDLCAWKNHITEYHKANLPSVVLSASHHGSRTFFKDKEEDAPNKEHMEVIKPTYVIISAPKQSESKHDHPHDDAVKIYKEYVGDDGLFHLGDFKKKRMCLIVDIQENGEIDISLDSKLWEKYKFTDEDGDPSKSKSSVKSIYPITQLDRKQMGN